MTTVVHCVLFCVVIHINKICVLL